MKILVINRNNNMGDAMCQMRALKEYKERNPEETLDFVSYHYLHYLMATHTDLFATIRLVSFTEINHPEIDKGYDKVIEFTIDWDKACEVGILRSWCETTLGFTPSTDRPYYLVRDEERIIAKNHAAMLRRKFDALVLMQLTTPSGYVRSFREDDHERVVQLFPKNVGILYPGSFELGLVLLKGYDHTNLVLLPAYDVGVMGALMNEVDYVFGAHGGTIMLAHAVGKKEVTQTMFGEGGAPNILKVPEWDNLFYPSHKQVDWDAVEQTIDKRLERSLTHPILNS